MPIVIGFIYYAVVFTTAFVLGVTRTVLVAPVMGMTAAVWLEVPIVLVVSWAVTRRLLHQRAFMLPQRLIMGATAFSATMISEIVFAHILRDQSVVQWADEVVSPLGLVGLAAQVAFAAMPAIVGTRDHGRR